MGSLMVASRFTASKKALTIPVTYLILFVSMLGVISLTYGFAITSLNSRISLLNISIAKQNMYVLDDAVLAVAWSPGTSRAIYIAECGGTLQVQPKSKGLMLNLNCGKNITDVIFSDYIGSVAYLLGGSPQSFEGLYLRGDKRVIVNGNIQTMTRLHFIRDERGRQQLVLTYRPMATVVFKGVNSGRPLNLMRVYVLSLSSSESLELSGKVCLRVIALNVTSYVRQYVLSPDISALTVEAVMDGYESIVQLPITNDENGAIVNLEVLVAHVRIQRVIP